jgi:hypothetical protein
MLRIFIFLLVWTFVCYGAASSDGSNNAEALLNLLLAIVGAFVMAPFDELFHMSPRAAVQGWLVIAGLILLLSLWRAASDRRREALRWACISVNLGGFVIAYQFGMTAEGWMGFR